MNIPDSVREEVRNRVWAAADSMNWITLSVAAKSKQYEAWTREPTVGGLLSHYISLGDVRVCLKDTFLKDYARTRQSDATTAYRVLGFPHSCVVRKTYVKPHGRQLADGRIVCWGRASAWKAILMAAYERAAERDGLRPFAVLLMRAVDRYKQDKVRRMVEDAAKRLGIEKVHWVET